MVSLMVQMEKQVQRREEMCPSQEQLRKKLRFELDLRASPV